MRILIIDANYPPFLDSVYRSDPGLRSQPYEQQRAAIRKGLFGEVGHQVDALRELGHEADSIVANATHAQGAWARENGLPALASSSWTLRRRRRIPWPTRSRPETAWQIVISQARRHRPDVVYVGVLDSMPAGVVNELRSVARLVVAQIAAPIPDQAYDGYHLVISSVPALVDRFRRMDIPSELVPLAFAPSVALECAADTRDIPISFIGSFTVDHPERPAIVESVAREVPLATWTPDRRALPSGSPIRSTVRGAVFGRAMYSILARSVVTLNTHGRIAGPDANNLRLFEATGMGAMLLTDHKRNLDTLFDVGLELVTYRSPDEAAELARYFVDRPDEARLIAATGRTRTLRDHTWLARMKQTVALLTARM